MRGESVAEKSCLGSSHVLNTFVSTPTLVIDPAGVKARAPRWKRAVESGSGESCAAAGAAHRSRRQTAAPQAAARRSRRVTRRPTPATGPWSSGIPWHMSDAEQSHLAIQVWTLDAERAGGLAHATPMTLEHIEDVLPLEARPRVTERAALVGAAQPVEAHRRQHVLQPDRV